MPPLIQCVPNFSEGRDLRIVEALADAARSVPGASLVDYSADPDHNRCVLTLLGPPQPVLAACHALAAAAVQHINLPAQSGVHPRLGAMDVLPLVPLSGITLAECAVLACALGAALAQSLGLPVFLYEAASPAHHSLPHVRREAFCSLMPDFGLPVPHPTAGAVVVGARGPLVAFNVNLTAPDVGIARTVAREVRAGGGAGFVGVRALGLTLARRGETQVSMNITQPEHVPLAALVEYIRRRAQEMGTTVTGCELIGALPAAAAARALGDMLGTAILPGQILPAPGVNLESL